MPRASSLAAHDQTLPTRSMEAPGSRPPCSALPLPSGSICRLSLSSIEQQQPLHPSSSKGPSSLHQGEKQLAGSRKF
ncbi:hypothetical protein PVAP13_8NG088008 [Panicum virgatum]|uniref:Uncharacterized protein n=1 Tax=Panicum virgatum TaxID=38727 RepID=A0A8T0P6X7_PANVG|nr:hypothetical protein PVAP13_8NG088008 [Panicum virgatum]